ncbi:hypothetical protein FRC11_012716, partial [Ceratobasidium sp. 423]
SDITTWATLIKHHEASLKAPPDELNLLDCPSKPCGVASSSKQVLQPSGTSATEALLAALTACLVQDAPPSTPAAPNPPPATISEPDHTADDWKLDWPTLVEWLESVADIQPCLMDYAQLLEDQAITHLNHLDNPDLTVKQLMDWGVKFVHASALVRMGKAACKEFRNTQKN